MVKPPKPLPGCASCPRGSTKEKCFVEPWNFPEPNIIIIAAQSIEDKSGEFQDLCYELDARPIVLGAAQCSNRSLPDLPVIKECREAYVNPLLVQYPELPIVTLGEEALSSIYGGVRKLEGKTGMRYKARMKDSHIVQHTYPVDEWGTDWKYEHAKVVLASSVRPFQGEMVERSILTHERLVELFKNPSMGLDIEIDVPQSARERGEQFVYPYEGGKLAMLGLTDGEHYYVMTGERLDDVRLAAAHYSGIIYGHNVKGDLTFLAAEGIEFPKAAFHDTWTWEHTQPARSPLSTGLKWLAKARHGASAYEARVHTEWERGIMCSQMPDLVEPYLTLDLLYHWKLYEEQRGEQHSSSSFQLALDYLPVVRDMELNGFMVDAHGLDRKIESLEHQAKLREKELQEAAYRVKEKFLQLATAQLISKDHSKLAKKQAAFEAEFLANGINVDSPKQMKAFFEALGFPVDATNEGVLAEIQDHCPEAKTLLAVKSIHKKLNTNCYEYRRLIQHPESDSCIHAHYGVCTAETTRLRCSQPNMQNVEGGEGGLRGLFISRYDGGSLVISDLSAIEYRIIAHLSEDAKLSQLFIDGVDIHRDAAARVFGIRPEQVTPEQRKIGKTCNFAGVYGAGPEKIFKVIGKEDWKTYHKINKLYPGVGRWQQRVIEQVHRTGIIENPFGQWWEFRGQINQAIEREAVNRIVQSAGHSILILYRLAVQDAYREALADGVLGRMPLMVQEGHDAFVDDIYPGDELVAQGCVEHVAAGLNDLIEQAFGVRMRVPILAETKLVDRWE